MEYFGVIENRVFIDVTALAGLAEVPPFRVAWGDYDSDGDDDLLVNGANLYRNDGGIFSDVSIEARVLDADGQVRCGGNGGVWADYNNDGWLDFYSTSVVFVPMCETGEEGDWYCDSRSGGTIQAVPGRLLPQRIGLVASARLSVP